MRQLDLTAPPPAPSGASSTPVTVGELLERVERRLASSDAWTKRVAARALGGKPVRPDSPAARCWCLLGALARETVESEAGQLVFAQAWLALSRALPPPRGGSRVGYAVSTYQDADETTHADVLALIRRARTSLS